MPGLLRISLVQLGSLSSLRRRARAVTRFPRKLSLRKPITTDCHLPQGAFQRVYTDGRDIDETMNVEDGDLVMVPRGYHPVGAPHGYDLYYLNVMAGPRRNWVFANDPVHDWIVRGA